MSKLKKYDLSGNPVGEVAVDEALVNVTANGQMIKDYITALRANKRQWSACTQGRSEVNHSNKKPHPQKGTGRARQGSLAAAQYKGGGVVFGPKPKFDQHIRINKKERRAAIRSLIADKIRENRVVVLDNLQMDSPKTKTVSAFLKKLGMGGRVLFMGDSTFINISGEESGVVVSAPCMQHDFFQLSLRNIPRTAFALASNVSGYDVMLAHDIVVTEKALQELKNWLT